MTEPPDPRRPGPRGAGDHRERFLLAVRARVRPVAPDVQRSIDALLRARPHLLEEADRDLLRASLCALIARSVDEAERIGAVFDLSWRPLPPVRPPRPRRSGGVDLPSIPLLAAAALALWLLVGDGIEPQPFPIAAPQVPLAAPLGVVAPMASAPGLLPAEPYAGPYYQLPYRPSLDASHPFELFGLVGATFLLLLGVRLLVLFNHRQGIAHDVAERARMAAEADKERAAHDELAVDPPLPRPAVWVEPPPGSEVAGRILRRASGRRRSQSLDVERTARATAEAAGRFEPVFQLQRRSHRLTVLIDDEGGEHVWAGAFRAMVASWRRLGVELVAWRFDRDPRRLLLLDRPLPMTLTALARERAGQPLIVLARDIDPRIGGGRWLRHLAAWSIAVWVDPDPRRWHDRRPVERRAIDRLRLHGLHRFPMTSPGLAAAAEALVSGNPRAQGCPPWPGVPDRHAPQATAMLRRWRVAVSQKPDATWELVEHLRREVPGVAEVFASRLDVQALIDDVRHQGGARADRPGERSGSGSLLFVEHGAAVRWLVDLLDHDPEAATLNHQIADLLIDWERSHVPASPHARALSELKILWHQLKKDPIRQHIDALVAQAGTAVHDHVEDYVGALSQVAGHGTLDLDAAAHRALQDGEALLVGNPARLPISILRRSRWRPSLVAFGAVLLALAMGIYLSLDGPRVQAESTWRGEAALAATDLSVGGYLRVPFDGGIGADEGLLTRSGDLGSPDEGGSAIGEGRDAGVGDRDARVVGDGGAADRAVGSGDAGRDAGRDATALGDASVSVTGVTLMHDGGVPADATARPDPDAGAAGGLIGRVRVGLRDAIERGGSDAGVDPISEAGPPTTPRPPDLRCEQTEDCRYYGHCTQRGDRCIATRPEQCRASSGCRIHGRCILRGGFCAVGSTADCRNALGCRAAGLCAMRGNQCIASDDAACKASENCKEQGRCRAVNGICRAGTVGDCAASSNCGAEGACTMIGGACWAATPLECQQSSRCRELGKCTMSGQYCVVATDADCSRSMACEHHGLCIARDGKCVVGDDGACAASRDCTTEGRCTAGTTGCIATRRPDCIDAGICLREGRCTPIDGECRIGADDCRLSTACLQSGLCTTVDGRCEARTRGECAESTNCMLYGRCEPRGGQCRTTAIDCQRAQVCLTDGRCTERDGRCVVASPADCARHRLCRDQGRCEPQGESCAATRAEHCIASIGCGAGGACTLVDDTCQITSDADCRQAIVCRNEGRCRERNGRCVR